MTVISTGAKQRRSSSSHHGAGTRQRMAGHFAFPSLLSQFELQRLVAAMVD